MESVGSFKLLERLGAGALGELYRARDILRGRTVALRVIDPGLAGDPATREALLADARRAQTFAHPHAAGLIDVVEEGEALYLVHELAEGQSLSAMLAGHPLEPRLAVDVARQVAEALAAGSDSGLVHGSLDPGSIIVSDEGQVKVLDIGLSAWTGCGKARRRAARVLEGDEGDPVSPASAFYLSPEQALGAAGDRRADVFALGVILHEMLTGRTPFAGDDAAATVLKIVQAQPVVPSVANPAVPTGADAIVQRALSKSLDVRYPGAAPLSADLRELLISLPLPKAHAPAQPSPGHRSARPRAGIGKAAWAAMGAVAVVVILAAVAWFGRNALGLPWQDEASAVPRPNVLVMSFVVSGEGAPPYFGPGFAEDLAARVSEIPGGSVVGRTAIRESASQSDWRARARSVGATVVVRGTIRPGPYALHADVELLDVESGQSIWAQHFSREPRQVSALQAEIAGQVAQRLRLVTPSSNRWARASVRKIDPSAYDLYLQGRDAADRRDRGRAIGLYDQALQIDPGLVEARAGLSQALYLEEYYAGGTREAPAQGRALREAEAALAVDAELPAAHLAAALAAPTITMAASALSRALAYDPSNGEAWHHAGDLVSELDPPRAIPFYRASLALEPSIDANWRDIASAYAAAGRQQEAEQAVAKGEAARPDRPWWKQMRARLDLEQGRYEGALQLLGADPSVESTPIVWLMGRVVPLALAGRAVDAQREAMRLVDRYPSFCEGRAVLSAVELDAGTGDRGRQLSQEILADASRADAEPALKVCAALAAAGTGDPAEAASWLSRVAGDDRALRVWTRQAIFGVGLSFRSRWYPWNKVIGSQPMQVAALQLEQTLQRLRDEVERRLPAPPGSVVPGR